MKMKILNVNIVGYTLVFFLFFLFFIVSVTIERREIIVTWRENKKVNVFMLF